MWSFRTLALAGGLVVAFGLGEIVARVYPMQPPKIEVQPVDADAIPNPLGLRDPPMSVPTDPSLERIAFLGDSFTYGLGAKPDQAFPRRVGALLDRVRPKRYVTINLGKTGNDLPGEWLIYNRVRDVLHPQVVVHVISPNDLDVDFYKDLHPIEHLYEARFWPSQYSYLFHTVELKCRRYLAQRRSIDYLLGGSTPAQRDRAWNIAAHEINATRRLVEQGGGIYVLVRFPYLADIRHHPLEEAHRRTADVAQQFGLTYLDLWETFNARSTGEMTLPDGSHPNAAAHELAAEAIADFLIKVVLPEVPPSPTRIPCPVRSPADRDVEEVRHFKRLLELDPTCLSAQFWQGQVTGQPIPPR